VKKPTTQHIGTLKKKTWDGSIPGGSRRPLDAGYDSAFTLSTRFAAPNQGFQAATAPTLLEPDFLTGTNVFSHFPPVVYQGLVQLAVGTEPQGNAFPLPVRPDH
jgi:hypothetical protein